MRFAELDAVTVDAFGTLVELIDPLPPLREALAAEGLELTDDEIRAALHAEQRYYREHLSEGRDRGSLARLRVGCTEVFLAAAGAQLDAEEFEPAFIGALRFRVLDGVERALRALRDRGLVLAVVANWDISLVDWLERLGLHRYFSLVEPLAGKPGAEALLRTLRTLGIEPGRALHVGDEPADERAASVAGVHYRPAPLVAALAGLR